MGFIESKKLRTKFGKSGVEGWGFTKSCLLNTKCFFRGKARNYTLKLSLTEMISFQHFLRKHLNAVPVMNVLEADYEIELLP